MKISEMMECCLFFSANRLSRIITKMAEASFLKTGLSPTECFAIMVLNESGTISSTTLGKILSLSPSTVTRFIDKLVLKGYCIRSYEGKNSNLTITQKGLEIQKEIEKSWEELYENYSRKIGYEKGDALSLELSNLSKILEK